MRGQGDYVTSGGGKKPNRPNTKAKVTARKTARKESGMSAQKFYVKTRMAEAAKGGKTVNAKDLRKKFQSGEVTRKGFGAPKKSTGGTGSSSTGSSSKGSSSTGSSSTVKDNRKRSATQNMRGAAGYIPGRIQKSTKSPNKGYLTPQEMYYPEKYRNVRGATKSKFTPYKP